MDNRLHASLEKATPVLYYKLLKIRRKHYLKSRNKLDIEDIKRLDDQMYLEKIGKHVDWENPKAYTEKMQIEKILHKYPEKALLTDKYLVREWVSKKIGSEYLVPLCGEGVYDSPYDIDFSSLPDSFVIKTNAGSGDAVIVRDKSALTKKDISRIKAKMSYQMQFNYSWLAYEMHYADIVPKVIVEKFIESGKDDLPDYKFLCFDGRPLYCWVDMGRYHDHKRNVYDLDWDLQSWNQKDYGNYDGIIERPENFDKMIEIATVLSEGFSHVRVDLYNVNGTILFGEMTFTNGSGFEPIIPYEADLELGSLWDLKK